MVAIGIDVVEIDRFAAFVYKSDKQLRRIFSDAEITYCRSNPVKSAERFAVRFAAKEALFKALTQLHGLPSASFLTMCRHASVGAIERVSSGSLAPAFEIDWKKLEIEPCAVSLSLSHTKTTAVAMVLVQPL